MKIFFSITINALFLTVLSQFCFGQVKVASTGSVAIGTVNNPWVNARLHVVSGAGGYSAFSESTSLPSSSAMIRGLNTFSTATNPDYTWWGNDQTGIFHPSNNTLAITIGGLEKARFTSNSFAFSIHGNAYASGVWSSSDSRFKKNITEIKDPLNRILQLEGSAYEFKTDEFKSFSFNPGLNYGFIAQDLAKVFPEVVKADDMGFLAVNYDMLIPVLVEAIKLQQKTIDLQSQRINALENSLLYKEDNEFVNVKSSANLYQNIPNPFNESTTIKCDIPLDSKVAELFIYDMQGSQIKNIKISEKGNVSVVLKSNELKPGMYFYSLFVDRKEIDTKKMILTAN